MAQRVPFIVAELGRDADPFMLHLSAASGGLAIANRFEYTNKVTDVLGANTSLHFQTLFADPRGLNLRNEMAHGLLGASAFDGHIARLLIHTLLILGLWKELAGKP